MNCERCQQKILHSLAAGETFPEEVSLHQNSCTICSEFHSSQRNIFYALDVGLHSIANPPIPPSLLLGLRIRLQQNPAASSAAFPGWSLALATTALVLALFGTFSVRQPTAGFHPAESIPSQALVRPDSPAETNSKSSVVSTGRTIKSVHRSEESASSEAEIIVLAEERHAYSKYLAAASEPGPGQGPGQGPEQGPEQAKVPLMPIAPVQPVSDDSEEIALVKIESLELPPLQGAGE